jgi:transcriptional regulator with XRE-family HTH domain
MTDAAIPEWGLTDRLAKARSVAGLKQQELAEYLGLSRASLSAYENGSVVPRLGILRLWAMRCGVPLDWLRYGTVPPGQEFSGSGWFTEVESLVPAA